MEPRFFIKQSDFRKWLEKHHDSVSELLVGFYKTGTKKASITWPESVDEALCFGWIDGVRKSIDDESYSIRFTPRKANSIWSAVNIKKVEELTQKGLMTEAGKIAFSKRKESKSKIYSFESERKELSPAMDKQFKANKVAWKNFCAMAPSYQKAALHLIMTAKQEVTQQKRLKELIEASAENKKIKQLSY